MKRLVLIGEGHAEVDALPSLVKKLLKDSGPEDVVFVDHHVIRSGPTKLIKWDRERQMPDPAHWLKMLKVAALRRNIGAVLAVFDGDCPMFPAGSPAPFCAAEAARLMAAASAESGAGRLFSLAIVFACPEYETWLIGSTESLAGERLEDGRFALPPGTVFPPGDPESHGKRWLQQKCPGYRPTRDQVALTRLLRPEHVRQKNIRSFRRLESALAQLAEALLSGRHVCTPR